MKYFALVVALGLLTGCGLTYIYSPKTISVTSPSAKVTLGETDNETFNETEIDKFGAIKD